MTHFSIQVSALILGLFVLSGDGFSAANESKNLAIQSANATATAAVEPADFLRQDRVSLKSMGAGLPIGLRGTEASSSVSIGVRLDEVPTAARLHLVYTLSPALLPALSHLKILLNDEVLQTVLVDKDKLGMQQAIDLAIDPRYFSDYNRLRFQLIGHYTLDCEMPEHSSLWASISNESYLDLTLRQLPLKNDLALLPAPFFDRRDQRLVEVPMVFGAQPSVGLLKASGSVASWIGMQATYRGARFPVLENRLPQGHAMVLATNQNRPDFLQDILKDMEPVHQPTLMMVTHPERPQSKLLLILGQDEAQVQQAADVLAIGQTALTGQRITVGALEMEKRRAAYDAPRWITTQRPVQIGELVASPGDLRVQGTTLNDVVRVNTRMAPDLFTWNAKGVPMNLLYRYTTTNQSNHGSLNLSINDQFVKSYPLLASGDATSGASNILLPLFDDSGIQAKSDFKIPVFLIGGDNQLQFAFNIPPADMGRCRSVQPTQLQAAIDPQSTIDLTGFYHYTAMPNLAAYANSGFPFTKYADLAETSVILPNKPGAADIEVYLAAVGRMGAATGFAGTRFRLLTTEQVNQAKGTDLLVVSSADSDGLLARWNSNLPALIAKGSRSIRPLNRAIGSFMDLFSMDAEVRLNPEGGRALLEGDGPLAAIVGLESPLDAGRSAVVLTATDASAQNLIVQTLNDPGKVQSIRGDLSLMRGTAVESFRINPVFYAGDLPWWRKLWFLMHSHPTLLAFFGILSGLFLSFVAFVALRARARRRMENVENGA